MKAMPLLALSVVFLSACGEGDNKAEVHKPALPVAAPVPPPLFKLLSPQQSGVTFTNTIRETAEGNFSKFDYMYNGNGVAVGDLNGDGLSDLYITGNQQSDRLYLNRTSPGGSIRFEDVTERAGISNGHGWKTGVCMVDIDADGDLDIYVSRSGWYSDPEIRRNLLYVNNGDMTFTENAAKWGIDDPGYSVQAGFTDLDGDGDLDMYLMNHPVDFKQTFDERIERMKDPDPMVSDRLYRNDGDHFTDVSIAGGIREYGHGLGLVFWDINGDGLDDIFIANDFQSADYLWINQGGMRFKDALRETFPHVSYFSMGCDVADFDNDLDDDLFVVEMLPWEHKRETMNLADMDEFRYYKFVEAGFHHQYMRNVFQMNNGIVAGGKPGAASLPHFSDIAWISGTAATDWSWTGLFADMDNDGWKDLLVTNGYLRDTQDRDYKKKEKPFIESKGGMVTQADLATICKSVKIPNRVFRNMGAGGVRFEEVGARWGLIEKAFSYGAAAADLDNDGDLDLVIGNTTLTLEPDPAFIYENQAVQQGRGHWLAVKLNGTTSNPHGEGARVTIRTPAGPQMQTMRFTRGFQSSMDPILHFGIGDARTVEEVAIHWPDGAEQILRNVQADRTITLAHTDAKERGIIKPKQVRPLLTRAPAGGVDFTHRETVVDDYEREKQLPERLSRNGPCMAAADINGDGREDLYIGGAKDQMGAIFIATANGDRKPANKPFPDEEKVFEDRVCTFLDADNDGDQDLFVGSGSVEHTDEFAFLARLYMNDGKGRLARNKDALPPVRMNAGAVAAADYDGDGRTDLFIGGRSNPGQYPATPRSFLLHNDGGRFTSVATTVAPALERVGMVTAAQWADLDADGDQDLVIVGDWMKVRTFRNDGGQLVDATDQWLPASPTGWWRSLAVSDVDGDGDRDIVAGNYGLNHRYQPTAEHPLLMLHNDFDHNNTRDIVLARWVEGAYRPDRSFTYLKQQFPFLMLKYEWHEEFAAADLVRVFGNDVEAADRFTAEVFATTLFVNEGGRFTAQPLPDHAQLSSVNAIAIHDLDGDGRVELVLAGNTFLGPVETGSNDAGCGAVLTRKADGTWRVMPPAESGFIEPGMVRGLVITGGQLLVGNNNGPVHRYTMRPPAVP